MLNANIEEGEERLRKIANHSTFGFFSRSASVFGPSRWRTCQENNGRLVSIGWQGEGLGIQDLGGPED